MNQCIVCKEKQDQPFALFGMCNSCIEGMVENLQCDNVTKESRIAELEAELAKREKKICGNCEFFNPDGKYLYATRRQNGKMYGQHVINGSVCHVTGVQTTRDEFDFICARFRPLSPALPKGE